MMKFINTILSLFAVLSFFSFFNLQQAHSQIAIPAETDWTDHGLVLDTGTPGVEWDTLMEGLTPCSIIKKDGIYYLYYVGSDDYIPDNNNIGPANRSIGVATSTDGINWIKYSGNPIVTWSVTGNEEEGAPSFGVYVDDNGEFVAYYGANTSLSATSNSVNADTRLAVSSNGLDFTDLGEVVNHADSSVWGNGDEIHTNLAYKSIGGDWYSYYVPNGVPQSAKLGVAWGPDRDNLTNSAPVVNPSAANISARGPASIVDLGSNTLAFFINFGGNMTVRTTTPGSLTQLSDPVETYNNFAKGVVLLDTDRSTWFMYYNEWTHVGFKTAPVGTPDITPPSAPSSVLATAISHSKVNLTWAGATDTETGILEYNIYRNSALVGTTRGTSFEDSGLSELSSNNYEVKAVNLHGLEGPAGTDSMTMPSDTTAPGIKSVSSAGDNSAVYVTFDETVEQTSAETASNYSIDGGISVFSASLGADLKTVALSTSLHADNGLYTLTVNNISDTATSPNINGNVQASYTVSGISGLVAYWRMDEGAGSTANDTSGYSNDGIIYNSPSWASGKIGLALDFDGVDDFVEIYATEILDSASKGDFTYTAWVQVADIPANTDQDDKAYTIFRGLNDTGQISYDYNQKFVCKSTTTDGPFEMASLVISPGAWNHVALVRDSASSQIKFYVNGSQVTGSPVNFTGIVKPPFDSQNYSDYYSNIWLGSADPMFSWGKYFINGIIDEIRIYNRALSDSEVIEVFNISEDTNNPPTADDDSAATDENTTVTVDVLSNDNDPDGNSMFVDNVTQGTNGSVVNNGSDVTYTPNTGFFGTDSFTYNVTDGFGGFDTATVNVIVNCTTGCPSSCGDGTCDADETCSTCLSDCGPCGSCGNGVCEAGEDCGSCPADCISAGGSSCGNGICEAANGEDCNTCASDCNSKTQGNPKTRFCCGQGGACGNSKCNNDTFSCIDTPVQSFCCGDSVCEGAEDSFSCEVDCGPPPVCGDGTCDSGEDICSCAADCGTPPGTELSCSNGSDDDCDGAVDCSDSDCTSDPICDVCVPTHSKEKGPRCSDGIDNDCDGAIDGADSDC